MPSSAANAVSPPAASIISAVSSGVMPRQCKHRVYVPSNAAFNTSLNSLFSVWAMEKAESTIERALRIARERKGWNQARFAAELNKLGLPVLPQHITNWKRRGLPPEHHAVVARALDITVDELLGINAPRSGAEALTDRERRLLNAFRAASPEVKSAIEGAALMAASGTDMAETSKTRRRDVIEDRPLSQTKKRTRVGVK